jgi:predicted RNA binding protein YcfA (HicA-like mRNA interferase family)
MKSSELLRLLKQAGWQIKRSGKGSHNVLIHPDKPGETIIFPAHGSKEVGKGLEKKIKKDAGLK